MPTRRNKRKQRSDADIEDEVVIDEQGQYDWLSNQIESEAKKRSKTKYDAMHVCVMGLERIVADVHKESFDDLPATAVEAKITLAKMYYERFHERLVDSTGSATASVLLEKARRMESIDTMYSTLMETLCNRFKELKLEESAASVVNSTVHHHESQMNDIQVKKLEIEKFGGDLHKWTAFKSMFVECFHGRDGTNTSKFYQLRAHLVPDSEAYNTIAGFDLTDANYEPAWKLLCDTYDNNRKIVNDIVVSFLDMEPVEHPNRTSLIKLVNTTNNLLQSLPKQNVNVDHWGPTRS